MAYKGGWDHNGMELDKIWMWKYSQKNRRPKITISKKGQEENIKVTEAG